MNIHIGNKLMRHMVLVAGVTNEGLTCNDFLRAHQMIIHEVPVDQGQQR